MCPVYTSVKPLIVLWNCAIMIYLWSAAMALYLITDKYKVLLLLSYLNLIAIQIEGFWGYWLQIIKFGSNCHPYTGCKWKRCILLEVRLLRCSWSPDPCALSATRVTFPNLTSGYYIFLPLPWLHEVISSYSSLARLKCKPKGSLS